MRLAAEGIGRTAVGASWTLPAISPSPGGARQAPPPHPQGPPEPVEEGSLTSGKGKPCSNQGWGATQVNLGVRSHHFSVVPTPLLTSVSNY